MDTFGKARANACIQTGLMKGCVFQIPNLPNFGCVLDDSCLIVNRFWRRVLQISDLSAFVGWLWAYNGSDG